MLGAYLVMMVSIATVYLGTQAVQLLFLVTGWSEGLLLTRDVEEAAAGGVVVPWQGWWQWGEVAVCDPAVPHPGGDQQLGGGRRPHGRRHLGTRRAAGEGAAAVDAQKAGGDQRAA